MSHYEQSLLIEAKTDAVYAALTTPGGLRGWWTEDCDVATVVGGTHEFRFGPHYKQFRIETLEPDAEVRWLCTVAHLDVDSFSRKDEWVGTRIVFRLSASGQGQTRLDLEHLGLVPEFECYEICAGGWKQFLESLQQYVETGRGKPFQPAAPCNATAANASSKGDAASVADSIERSVVIEAERDRVWKALVDAETFGTWFGADLKGKRFVPGERTQGSITIPNFEHIKFDVVVERIEPKNLMSYRWHPAAVEQGVDYSAEPRTLVTFTLVDLPNNQTRLTVIESGFQNVPPERRFQAFRMNTDGWTGQLGNIKRYAEAHAQV